jgi:hypothetical protein
LFLRDQSIALRAEWIDLEDVRISTVMGGVNDDFKVVVQLLGNIAPKFRGYYLFWLRVETGNAEVDLVFRVENANFGLFRRRLSLEWFPLQEVGDRRGLSP